MFKYRLSLGKIDSLLFRKRKTTNPQGKQLFLKPGWQMSIYCSSFGEIMVVSDGEVVVIRHSNPFLELS